MLKTGRPVRGISLWLDYRLWGMDARMFHLTNNLLHVFCVLAAFYLLIAIFKKRRLAFMSALIFAVMPVNSEAVISIAHRKETLCFLFMALSFLSFKKWTSGYFRPALSFVFYTLALLSKQVALTLPFLILIESLVLREPEPGLRKKTLILTGVMIAFPLAGFALSLSDFRLFSRFQPRLPGPQLPGNNCDPVRVLPRLPQAPVPALAPLH